MPDTRAKYPSGASHEPYSDSCKTNFGLALRLDNSKILAPPSLSMTLNVKPSRVLQLRIAASASVPVGRSTLGVRYALASFIRSAPFSLSVALDLSPSDFVFASWDMRHREAACYLARI